MKAQLLVGKDMIIGELHWPDNFSNGLAAGAFFGIVGVVEIGYATSYALLAIMSAVAAVWHRQSTKPV